MINMRTGLRIGRVVLIDDFESDRHAVNHHAPNACRSLARFWPHSCRVLHSANFGMKDADKRMVDPSSTIYIALLVCFFEEMKMSKTRWEGIFPAVTTKFKENEELDFAEMEKHFSFQIENGVHALVTCGSLGEASTLSFEEKLDVARTALQVADKCVPVLVNVSETRTRTACRFVEEAAKLGVQGLMVMPSVLYAADAREAKDNLRTIARAAQLPIMVYNNPVSYKVDLLPQDFADLADCEWIVAIKSSARLLPSCAQETSTTH